MTMATKHDVLAEHLPAWLAARKDKKKRGDLIRLICQAIRLHPKSIPRAMKRLRLRGKERAKRPGRPRRYGLDVAAALFDVREAGDHCCGELLHPMHASRPQRQSDNRHTAFLRLEPKPSPIESDCLVNVPLADGLVGYLLGVTTEEAGFKFRILAMLIEKGETGYGALGTSLASAWEKHGPVIRASLMTLEPDTNR